MEKYLAVDLFFKKNDKVTSANDIVVEEKTDKTQFIKGFGRPVFMKCKYETFVNKNFNEVLKCYIKKYDIGSILSRINIRDYSSLEELRQFEYLTLNERDFISDIDKNDNWLENLASIKLKNDGQDKVEFQDNCEYEDLEYGEQ